MSALWALSVILLASGVAKLQAPEETAAAFDRLKVPAALSNPRLVRAFPVLEIALAFALLLPFTALRPVVAAVALALFVAFLLLVVRGMGSGESCGCFGAASARPITGWTVVRNIVFVLLAAGGLLEAIIGLMVQGATIDWWPLAGLTVGLVEWTAVVTVLSAAAAFLVGRDTAPLDAPSVGTVETPETADDAVTGSGRAQRAGHDFGAATDEPLRRPLPDAPLVVDGRLTTVQAYSKAGAVLFLYLSPGCGSCARVIERLEDLDGAIGPVRVRAVLPVHNDDLNQPMKNGRIPAEIVVQDPTGVTGRRLGLSSFPSAVIAGADGKTAGGPVFGADEVNAMIDELVDVMADADLPTAAELEQAEQERVERVKARRAGGVRS